MRLEPGSTQPLGVYGLANRARFYTAVGARFYTAVGCVRAPEKKKTKLRHKEQSSAQASSESGNEKINKTKPAHG